MMGLRRNLLRRVLNTWRHNRRKRGYTIDMLPDGFLFTARRRETKTRWDDVRRIDIGLRPCLTYDVFYVQIFADKAPVYVEELDDGFRQFELALFERWPQIRARWDALLKAELGDTQHHTVWQRDA